MPAICSALRRSTRKSSRRHHRRHDRRRRVVDAREARRDVLLRPREQQERHDAERHRSTVMCPQILMLRGSRSRRSATKQPSVSAPRTRRDHATWAGERPSSATFMNRKLEPQTMPVSTNCTVTDAPDGPRELATPAEAAVAAWWSGFGRHPATLARASDAADPRRDASSEIRRCAAVPLRPGASGVATEPDARRRTRGSAGCGARAGRRAR